MFHIGFFFLLSVFFPLSILTRDDRNSMGPLWMAVCPVACQRVHEGASWQRQATFSAFFVELQRTLTVLRKQKSSQTAQSTAGGPVIDDLNS